MRILTARWPGLVCLAHSSVVNEQLVASCPWPGELAKLRVLLPPSLPPLFSQCEAHGPPIGVGREKNHESIKGVGVQPKPKPYSDGKKDFKPNIASSSHDYKQFFTQLQCLTQNCKITNSFFNVLQKSGFLAVGSVSGILSCKILGLL